MNRKRLPDLEISAVRPRSQNSSASTSRLQFSVEEAVKSMRIAGASAAESVEVVVTTTFPATNSESHGLNLFLLHSGNQLQDRESAQYKENVTYFSATDGDANSLTGLLDDSSDTPSISFHTTNKSVTGMKLRGENIIYTSTPI